MTTPASLPWHELESLGDLLRTDLATRLLYATDASIYRSVPMAVATPAHEGHLRDLLSFAQRHRVGLIPRTAGTSLAGQVVGSGVVVDFTVHFNRILHVDPELRRVVVQPGVIRDELNRALRPDGLFFGPNTSTASRCMIGGMVGNNSSGTTSIRYGTTRDKLVGVEALLSDGSKVSFGEVSTAELERLTANDDLNGAIYRKVKTLLEDPALCAEIERQYPHRDIHRRNTGYALDVLLGQAPFTPHGPPLNLAKLIAGSEGTLCMTTALTLEVDPLPPPYEAVICAHFAALRASLEAAVLAMRHEPYACELMDKVILDCTQGNIEQAENRFFVEGDPAAILCIELRAQSEEALRHQCDVLCEELRASHLAYALPVLRPPHTEKVWNLRAAGLGVLSNVKGPAKPIAFVEDTAVRLSDLPDYIDAFEAMMHRHRQRAVYYAHAGAGELHIRPVLNLKAADGRRDLRSIAEASAGLVKQYGGSLSGEHGDGRVRSEFIPQALGPMVYDALCALKKTFDPHGILNPGKIIAAPPMDTDLRYSEGQPPFTWPTFLDFSAQGNLQEAAEACNGSGDCRKPHATGATMCPSYQATLREQDSTRARANMLREVLTHPANAAYPMDSEPLREVLDLCLSCKACKRECPSSVDMALMKAEVSWQQGRRHGFGKAADFFGNFHRNAAWAVPVAPIVNLLLQQPRVANWVKKQFRIAPARSIPPFAARKATALIQQWADPKQAQLVLYIDEFTQYQDAHIALAAARLLKHTGFPFAVVYSPSGRSLISKGMLDKARAVAQETIARLSDRRLATLLVVGLEPSAVLGFRDEYPKLVEKPHRAAAAALAARALTFEEWWAAQVESRRVDHSAFPHAPEEVQLHLHCHQKALSHVKHSKISLSVLKGTAVKVIPSGCCGMAGSFGYEAEHYDLSMKIGELVLFPRVRQAAQDAWIVAAGTSCRHQIADGTGSQAMHPAEALCKAAGL